MCTTCGCENPENEVTVLLPDEKQTENHHHGHDHHHSHSHEHEHKISVEQDILFENKLLAERNRGFFEAKNIMAYNLMSSPGSGKTTLLEKTILALKNELEIAVIEGDQQTQFDAKRIEETGAKVVQVNTGNGCHLDASMINRAVKKIEISENSVLMIENVGNLVCPSLFDLGENKRIVIISTTEGEDKPLKYPTIFETADICIINKIDLLPYLNFDVEKTKKYALQVNHHLKFFEVSATTEEGIGDWLNFLRNSVVKA